MMNNNTISREVFDGFSGLELSSVCGKRSCRLDNFRVLADGSLEKREGTRQIASLPDEVRGVYAFVDEDEEVILAVAGDCLYRITADGQLLFASCFETQEGEVGFFVYGGKLYILDGVQCYRYDGQCNVTKVHGYTPLYGKNWRIYSSYENVVNEPINCFSSHIRIHYLLDTSTDYMYIGIKVAAIDWIMVDGVMLNASNYHLSIVQDVINFDSSIFGTNMEVCFTLPESYYKDNDLLTCVSAAVYEDFENSRVFFYGGNVSSKLFVSSGLSSSALRQDAAYFPESCGLYFPKTQSLSFGSGQSITAVQRIYDRMLVFFPSSLWVTEPMDATSDDEVLFSPICGHMGCSATNAVLMTGAASPISVTMSGIYRWKIDSDFLDECITTQMSDAVLPLLDDSFFENAEICHNRRRAELWFHDKTQKDGRIFLYQLDREEWYCYSGVSADKLFSYSGGVGFTDGGKICLFDEDCTVDSLVDGERDIEAVCESGWLDFDSAGAEKRLEEALFTADLRGGTLRVGFDDRGSLSKVTLSEANAVSSGIYELRMPTSRFRAAKLTLVADGPFKQRIYRAELFAQKGKK